MLSKVLLLKNLYSRRLIGEKYCDNIEFRIKKDAIFSNFSKKNLDETIHNCNLCELSKTSQDRILGQTNTQSKIAFITLNPILNYSASYDMIKNIANNVFSLQSYSLLSVIKCNTSSNIKDVHTMVCEEYLKMQLESINPNLIVLFGIEVAKCILKVDDELENLRGRILKSKNINNNNALNKERDFIVTYAISDLLKNQSLKKFALLDFMNIKEFIKN